MSTYQLSNTQLSLSFNSKGAELISVKTNQGVELLWQANPEIWSRHAPVLFPIVGKLTNNSYSFNEENYNLNQHGFARDLEFVLVEETKISIAFELTASDETLKAFPFHFSLIIKYSLIGGKINVAYKVFNPDNKNLLFSIGAHPGFSTQRVLNESLNDIYLEFENKDKLVCEKLDNGLLNGEIYDLQLNSNTLQLGADLFDKDALVFKGNQINSVTLCSNKSDYKIKLSCINWPYFGIWTKKDCDSFICLEPWHGITDSIKSNGELVNKEGIIELEPLKEFECEFSIEVLN